MAGEPSNVTGSRGVKLGLVVYLGSCRRRAPSWEQLWRQAQFQGGPAQLGLSKARPLGPSPPTRPVQHAVQHAARWQRSAVDSSQPAWAHVPALPLTSCATLGKLHNHFLPPFAHV